MLSKVELVKKMDEICTRINRELGELYGLQSDVTTFLNDETYSDALQGAYTGMDEFDDWITGFADDGIERRGSRF